MKEFIQNNIEVFLMLVFVAIIGGLLTLLVGYSERTKSYYVDGDEVRITTDSNGNQYVIITDRGFLVDKD